MRITQTDGLPIAHLRRRAPDGFNNREWWGALFLGPTLHLERQPFVDYTQSQSIFGLAERRVG